MGSRLLSLLLMLLTLSGGTVADYTAEMNLGGNLYLVNRDYLLPSDYEPAGLVSPKVTKDNSNVLMRAEAAEALEEMFAAAKKDGMSLKAVSGYRSYGKQKTIFQNKVQKVGKKNAMLLVAPPGASEHQLGLAMDLGRKNNVSLTESFFKTREGKWVAEHCYEYGFIIRYKEEWTEITGYSYEPWHVRYVGVEHAMKIKELDIPLEEYIDLLRSARYEELVGEVLE